VRIRVMDPRRRVLARSRRHALLVRVRDGVESLRAQLTERNRLAALGERTMCIAHELNNPLAAIAAYTEYLRRRWASREDAGDDLERLRRIGEAIDRAQRLSRSMLAFGRVARGRASAVDLHEVIERALSYCEHDLGNTHGQVVRMFEGPVVIRGHAHELLHVFINLFTNACHAVQKDAPQRPMRLVVSTSLSGADARVTVEDDGPGFDEDLLPRIFEPFVTGREAEGGTGLGLAIVKGITEAHGGQVRAENVSPGRGARIVLTLPLWR
jgi:signal transduction histidine kinase